MRRFVLLLGCFAASPLAAGETRLTGEAIKTTLSGSLLALDTPVGSTVSVRIGHDGLMSGEAGTTLGAVLGASKDRGRWWIVNDQVCFKWFRWFDAEPRCATISLEGQHLTWRRDDGDSGTATIVERDKPIEKPAVIVAQATKKPKEQIEGLPAKKAEIVVAASTREAERPPVIAEKPPVPSVSSGSHGKTPSAVLPAATPERRGNEAITVALKVPAPRPAINPKHHEKIAIAAVKPQFFAPQKVETAKAETLKIARKPFRVAGVDPSDVLNIRNGPSPDYQSVGSIPSNSHGITITGPCSNDWCPVRHRTLVGWVNRRYLLEETASNATATTELNYWDPAP